MKFQAAAVRAVVLGSNVGHSLGVQGLLSLSRGFKLAYWHGRRTMSVRHTLDDGVGVAEDHGEKRATFIAVLMFQFILSRYKL